MAINGERACLQPSSRGGFQPSGSDNMATPDKRNARVTLERLKAKVDNLIGQMETLTTNPTSTTALQRRISSAEKAWTAFEEQYDRLRAIAGER